MDALVYADTALLLVLDAQIGITTPADSDRPNGHSPVLWHAQVHQAAGMVSVQLGVTPLEALVRLRAYAYGHDARLTDIARSVMEQRLRCERDLLTEQLQTTLNNRVTIEQAKGVLADRRNTTVDQASELLRAYAHSRDQKLTDVADAVVRNDPAVADLVNVTGGNGS